MFQSPPDEVMTAVTSAIEAGYRHFDGAPAYVNETALGAAFREQFSAGRVKREDLFIVSKVCIGQPPVSTFVFQCTHNEPPTTDFVMQQFY